MCLDGLKWVVLDNRVGWSGFYVNMSWGGLEWVEMDTLYKIV